MNPNFNDRIRDALTLARDEATRLRHEYVGPEHLLLGLAREGEGVASAVVASLGVGWPAVVSALEQHLEPGHVPNAGPDLPYTSRAKTVLEYAMASATDLGHAHVGTEHLLLGIAREGESVAAQVMATFGLSDDRVRAATERLADPGPREGVRASVRPPVAPDG
jgi:ATP-dependent Clp protease ATP-binding subunit ClpC